jgi:hypothetical protein
MITMDKDGNIWEAMMGQASRRLLGHFPITLSWRFFTSPLWGEVVRAESSETALGMRAAIEWGKGCIDGAPAEGADLPLDQSATLGKYEIGTTPAALVLPRVVLIPGGGLCEFLLILRFVILGFSSGSTATDHGGDNAHCFDKCPSR